ncbi:aminotransferase class III-fold pyridoxal phosphate-dependent enzyme [Candidatus Gottesmanbacteria bacterium]|nr:aminotransferase class III-fold pyridoxal phosphate-dependent enzyme [Candidatus Gottesmanbacteria bacterium]
MKTTQVFRKVKKYIARAQYAGLYGIALESARGSTIKDVEGKEYLDLFSAASSVNVGYGRTDVIDAYATVAKKITQSCFVYSPNIETIELAEKLIRITPGNFRKKVMFGMSASDSIDGAIKAARKFTQRRGTIAFHNAYHGSTGLSAQATGFPGIRNGILSSDEFFFLDFPITKKGADACLKAAEEYFQTGKIACFIIEPIQGDGGNLVPPKYFFAELKRLTQKYGVILIDDEAQSGVGRTGKWWGIEHFDVIPDIIVVGKGISGGYIALGACIGRSEVIDSLDKAQHVFTYSGHPPACAVGTKILSIIEKENILNSVNKNGIFFIHQLNNLIRRSGDSLRCEVRGIGFQIGLSIRSKDDKPLAALFGVRCLEKGLYVGYFGKNNDVLRIHPPLTITHREILRAINIFTEVFKEWESNAFPKSTYRIYKTQCLGLGKN